MITEQFTEPIRGSIFQQRASDWMTQPVRVLHELDRLEVARDWMEQLDVSALPVVNGSGRISGVLSWSDLLRIGRVRRASETRRRALVLPDARARDHMSTPVEILGMDTSLQKAARQMVRQHIHRLYLASDRVPQGVLGTLEMVEVVAASKLSTPVEDIASAPLVSIHVTEPVWVAMDRLVESRRSVLVVLDGPWPVGLFGGEEALAARDAPEASLVEDWMTAGFLTVGPGTELYRAAARVMHTRPRCLLIGRGPEARGIVTGMDFTRVVAAG